MISKKNWESLVTLELPSDCWVVVWKIESEKQNILTFLQSYQKRKEIL